MDKKLILLFTGSLRSTEPAFRRLERSNKIFNNNNNNIQGDSGGICNTLGNYSMCDSKKKSSYEHGSDFERLPRYGKKKIRTILREQQLRNK